MYVRYLYISVLVIATLLSYSNCSPGDRSHFYQNCHRTCVSWNCTGIGHHSRKLQSDSVGLSTRFVDEILLWDCGTECGHQCMWKTTDFFVENEWGVPQFFGKWPFVRLFGMQEPASVIFSMMNMGAHLNKIMQFRRTVRPDSPMFYVWHAFCAICCNGWFWSIIFHIRDLPVTEFLDYTFAYSIVLATFGCMILRMIYSKPTGLKAFISTAIVLYYFYHVELLRSGQFGYSYNMKANVATGVMAGVGWITWYLWTRKTCSYGWKMVVFQILAAASLSLELMDFPPIWWTFDAHSLWHLATVPLTVLFYNFIIDDCRRLRQEVHEDDETKKLV